MSIFTLNIYCCIIGFLLINYGESLRCRSGNQQQSNDRVNKVIQTCRKKYSSAGNTRNGDDYTSSENDSSSEDSASSVSLDEELFFGNGNKKLGGSNSSRNSGSYGQPLNGNYDDNHRNDQRKQYPYVNRESSQMPNNSWMNERGMSNQNFNRNYQGGIQSQNRGNNNDRQDRAECITQCLFDELNLVDQRGFPERGSVMEIMTRGIQDPNLRDFIEESITECFHYLDSDTNNHEKCLFSKNLMSCFAHKGRERCEDWDDQ